MKIPKDIRILYTDYCSKFYNTHEKQSTTFGIRCKKGAAAPILELLYFRLCHKILVQTGSWTNNATLSIVLLIQFTFYGESYYGILHHKQHSNSVLSSLYKHDMKLCPTLFVRWKFKNWFFNCFSLKIGYCCM